MSENPRQNLSLGITRQRTSRFGFLISLFYRFTEPVEDCLLSHDSIMHPLRYHVAKQIPISVHAVVSKIIAVATDFLRAGLVQNCHFQRRDFHWNRDSR